MLAAAAAAVPAEDARQTPAWHRSAAFSTTSCAESRRRPAAMKDFIHHRSVQRRSLLGGSRVSDEAWQNSFDVAISSAIGPRCAPPRRHLPAAEDLPGLIWAAISKNPGLVIDGDQDRVLPYEATSRRLPASLETLLHRHRRWAARARSGSTPTRLTRHCSTSSTTQARSATARPSSCSAAIGSGRARRQPVRRRPGTRTESTAGAARSAGQGPLPEVGHWLLSGWRSRPRVDDVQRESKVALVGKVGSGVSESDPPVPRPQVEAAALSSELRGRAFVRRAASSRCAGDRAGQ